MDTPFPVEEVSDSYMVGWEWLEHGVPYQVAWVRGSHFFSFGIKQLHRNWVSALLDDRYRCDGTLEDARRAVSEFLYAIETGVGLYDNVD